MWYGDGMGAKPPMGVDRFIHDNVKAGKWNDNETLCNDMVNMRSETSKE